MSRWSLALLAALLACVPILMARASSSGLLQDTDTAFLLTKVRERQAPLSWFAGDWPLGNHFYRPVSTLAFEIDNRLYGNDAAGYGLTNALLCVACVLLLLWFGRELTESVLFAGGMTILFAMWHMNAGAWLAQFTWPLALTTLAIGVIRHERRGGAYLPAFLVLSYLGWELAGRAPLYERMIGWLPGRTASVMTVFALASLAAYARYERLGAAPRTKPEPGPRDPPATRNTLAIQRKRGNPIGWAILSVVCLALALGSYEQAVMLPAALLGVALTMRWRGYAVRWGWQVPFWGVLVGYLLLRSRIVPTAPSGYQLQQLRSGQGFVFDLLNYAFPMGPNIPVLLTSLSVGLAILFFAGPWLMMLNVVANVTAFVKARRHWVLSLAGWALSFLAYLPMAWLNQFDHYHYWPMAMRAILVVALVRVAAELMATAVAPPGLRAPPRPVPAPGSLPRP